MQARAGEEAWAETWRRVWGTENNFADQIFERSSFRKQFPLWRPKFLMTLFVCLLPVSTVSNLIYNNYIYDYMNLIWPFSWPKSLFQNKKFLLDALIDWLIDWRWAHEKTVVRVTIISGMGTTCLLWGQEWGRERLPVSLSHQVFSAYWENLCTIVSHTCMHCNFCWPCFAELNKIWTYPNQGVGWHEAVVRPTLTILKWLNGEFFNAMNTYRTWTKTVVSLLRFLYAKRSSVARS